MKSLRNRIVLTLFLVSAIMVLALSLYTGVVMGSTSTFLRQDIQERLLAESFSAALIIAPEELQQLQVPQDMDTPLYQELKGRLINFAEEHSVVYVYYIRLTPSGDCQFIIDNDTTEDTVSLATPSIPTEAAVASAFAGTPKTTDFESYSEGYSGLLSSYSPVYDQEGTVIAVAGVDISDHQILEVNRQTSTLTILLIMSIALVIFTGIGNVVLQMRKERELERQLDQQELMSSISQGFISQQSMQDLIIASLRQTGEFLGVERVLVAIASKDSDETRPMYVWVSEDRFVPDPAQEGFGGIIASTFPKTMPRNGMVPTLFCNDVRHDYNEKFTVFMKAGLRSFIWAPLYVDGSYWGLLSIEECGKKRTWTESEAQLVGTVSGAIANAVARDLIEKERVEALDHAIQAGQAKSDFLSNMSHEMRTPMNAIIGMTTIAQDAEDLERKDYCLAKIEEASSHLLGIINDVLDMSKIEANRLELAHTPFRFEQVVKKTIDIMSLKTLEKR
ncbi:MAG: GAF domain-containing protein, partial [Coriobacteriales bacterium]|nr:GAF domain-containing protein [Coriobacteriales bacterium]